MKIEQAYEATHRRNTTGSLYKAGPRQFAQRLWPEGWQYVAVRNEELADSAIFTPLDQTEPVAYEYLCHNGWIGPCERVGTFRQHGEDTDRVVLAVKQQMPPSEHKHLIAMPADKVRVMLNPRDRAIDDMMKVTEGWLTKEKIFKALYEAGYRK